MKIKLSYAFLFFVADIVLIISLGFTKSLPPIIQYILAIVAMPTGIITKLITGDVLSKLVLFWWLPILSPFFYMFIGMIIDSKIKTKNQQNYFGDQIKN
jgi:hypothetical protein